MLNGNTHNFSLLNYYIKWIILNIFCFWNKFYAKQWINIEYISLSVLCLLLIFICLFIPSMTCTVLFLFRISLCQYVHTCQFHMWLQSVCMVLAPNQCPLTSYPNFILRFGNHHWQIKFHTSEHTDSRKSWNMQTHSVDGAHWQINPLAQTLQEDYLINKKY